MSMHTKRGPCSKLDSTGGITHPYVLCIARYSWLLTQNSNDLLCGNAAVSASRVLVVHLFIVVIGT